MTESEKYDLFDAKAIVENEGLGYAIQHYMDSNRIKDPELAQLWDEAQAVLEKISKLLHLDE